MVTARRIAGRRPGVGLATRLARTSSNSPSPRRFAGVMACRPAASGRTALRP